jgi:hypothetical protein
MKPAAPVTSIGAGMSKNVLMHQRKCAGKKHLAFRPTPNALTPNGADATLVMSTMSLRKY